MKKFLLITGFLIFPLVFHAQILGKTGLQKFSGYFDFYYDQKEDKIYLEVKELDSEFLYVNSLARGLGSNDIGLDRGQLGQERIVKFKRAGNKLLMVQPNQNYRAVTTNVMEKSSVEEAFAQSVLFGFKIEDEMDDRFVIDLTPFLIQDAHGVANILKDKNEGDYKLDGSKSSLELARTKSFPLNSEFEAIITFSGRARGRNIRSVAPTNDLITVNMHHSFVKLPDDDYKPREFDPRSGMIFINFMDYATPVHEPIMKRYITRHRLEKKNPISAVSEAKEPIVYYLDPGTPEPVRSALLDGAKWWNQAYEAIGFKDAFQVKMLPEGADPLDCRYNVIQWVHRSTRGWSYGASVIDPRTGEIIKGHVSLGSLRIRQDFLIAQALLNKPFAERDDNYQPMLEMALARIRQLSAHEVGHTLGFTHNFASSVNDRASVMDYPHPMVTEKGGEISFDGAYDTGIGEWDKVTVAYAYSDFVEGTNEHAELNKILDKASSDGLRFISDSDARAAGGAHAYAHLWDNGKNAGGELKRLLKVRKTAISNFSKDNIRNGDPYSMLEDVFVPLYFFHRYQAEATTKMIGGLDYNYAVKGDGDLIVKPLDSKDQKSALEAILLTLDPEHLAIPENILRLFPPRAYGYNRTRESFQSETGVAFDPLSAASTASEFTLDFLLHPERANRLFQQQTLESGQLSLDDVLRTLIENSFQKKYKESYLQEVQHMVNVNLLNHIMDLAVNDKAYFQVNAIAYAALEDIERKLTGNLEPQSYSRHYKHIIDQFKENPDKFKMVRAPKIP
ncbi:zinc-dependent metalloprotease, partial [Aegicerativicinus sediminis]